MHYSQSEKNTVLFTKYSPISKKPLTGDYTEECERGR